MVLPNCNVTDSNIPSYCIPQWIFWTIAGIGFLMLLMILILSICLCRTRKRTKKQMSTEDDNPEEANLHYAELQNLPGVNRGQCDGGPCQTPPVIQNNDYATVAELQGTMSTGCGSPEQTHVEGLSDKNQLCEELE